MIGTKAFAHVMGRAMMNVADALHRHFECIGGDLREDGLDALTDRSRAQKNRIRAVIVDFEPRRLLRAGRAALDETGNAEPMIFAVDQSAAKLCPLIPADFRKTLVERGPVVAAVI